MGYRLPPRKRGAAMWHGIVELRLMSSRRTADRGLAFPAMDARMTAVALSAGQRHRLIRAEEQPDGLVLVRGKGPVQIKLRAAGITAAFGDCVDVCTRLASKCAPSALQTLFCRAKNRQMLAIVKRRLTRAGLMGGTQRPSTAEQEATLRKMVAARAKQPAIAAALGQAQGSLTVRRALGWPRR